jgi:hypothetical protein
MIGFTLQDNTVITSLSTYFRGEFSIKCWKKTSFSPLKFKWFDFWRILEVPSTLLISYIDRLINRATW